MTDQGDDRKMITDYLLGELPDPDQKALEARYFVDDALFEQLLAIEDEMIERYARGEVTPAERAQFERHFLASPARRKRVRFAKAWMRYVTALAAEVHRQRLSWWGKLKALLRPRKED